MIQKLMSVRRPGEPHGLRLLLPRSVSSSYWFTNNLWSMGQQFYNLKRMPHPNRDEARR
jgi:YidC/Oxa1 family membrane protein insertase